MRCVIRFSLAGLLLFADSAPQTLPFAQNWAVTGLIATNDNWSGVPGIEGFLGQDLTTTTATDPQTILAGASGAGNDLDVIANQTNPNTLTTGGVAEFDGIPNPTIALNGSGTADAPHIILTVNTTGQSNISVAYDLRDLDGSADNSVQPVALQYRVGNSGNFTNVPAGFVADATSGPSLATLVTPVSATLPAAADNQAVVQIRIITTNAAGNDEWVGIDNISVTGSSASRTLSINDVSTAEGNSGVTSFQFTVSLTQAAGPGGVSFVYSTADGTATVSGLDYSPVTSSMGTIAEGQTSTTVSVLVNGDTSVEGNETFFVNVTGVAGATVLDAQGMGTVLNDDVSLVSIHDIQGSGTASPIAGNTVTTRGIVTGVRSNGFYMQAPDALVDANPLTSEGIFVFTSGALPAAAAVGNLVEVTGTVTEFTASGSPSSLTELTSPATVFVSSGNPLPTAVPLTVSLPSPTGGVSQLERLEGMRVSVASLTVSQPTDGNVAEPSATSTSNGIFYGVVTGTSAPFREPGIEATLPVPLCAAGTGCAIPVWDRNPEVLAVDSDRLTGAAQLNVTAKSIVTGLVGVLDANGAGYILLPEPATVPTVSSPAMPTPAPSPTAGEVTVAAANLERFFDTINAPTISDPVLTAGAFNNRLSKVSSYVRDFMRSPDVIAVSEVEDLSTLQAIATRVNSDSVAASAPNPMYQAFLVEGIDPGGIDVGFLVKSASTTVTEILQEGAALTFIDPSNGQPDPVYDRPPLRFTGSTTKSGQVVPFTVYANHLRSLNGVETEARVRAKRKAQADGLANMVQTRQTANPAELIAVVGDMNAFEFNDGYADLIGTIAGNPAPSTQVQVASSDLVNPNLRNALEIMPAPERYSYRFEGNAQVLDHALLSQPLFNKLTRAQYVRVNADFPETERNNPAVATRISDHDAVWFAFSSATDVSSSVQVSSGTILLNRATQQFQFVLFIRNTSANTLNGPLHLVLSGLPSGVTITNAAGQSALGSYFTVPSALAPNATANVLVTVTNPARVPIIYTAKVLAGSL